LVTAAQASKSVFSVEWQALAGAETEDDDAIARQVPVRSVPDDDGLLHLVTLGSDVPVVATRRVVPDDDGVLNDSELSVERIEPRHLPRALILEFELFGDDSSLLADYAAGIAIGYCAIDTRRDALVGHVVIELVGDARDTLMYTTFATNDDWRGRGVAKAIVSSLHQWAFLQPAIVNGRMHVRGGHAEIIGLYRHYGFAVLEHDADKDGELVAYDDGQQPVVMGGPLRFDVFAKRLAWPWASRDELIAAQAKTQ
jgi:GNAT superfamily N-acetyltransferase